VELGRALHSAGLDVLSGLAWRQNATRSGWPGWNWRPASCLPPLPVTVLNWKASPPCPAHRRGRFQRPGLHRPGGLRRAQRLPAGPGPWQPWRRRAIHRFRDLVRTWPGPGRARPAACSRRQNRHLPARRWPAGRARDALRDQRRRPPRTGHQHRGAGAGPRQHRSTPGPGRRRRPLTAGQDRWTCRPRETSAQMMNRSTAIRMTDQIG